MTSVHREKSREGINKGVMRKEKKKREETRRKRQMEKKNVTLTMAPTLYVAAGASAWL